MCGGVVVYYATLVFVFFSIFFFGIILSAFIEVLLKSQTADAASSSKLFSNFHGLSKITFVFVARNYKFKQTTHKYP